MSLSGSAGVKEAPSLGESVTDALGICAATVVYGFTGGLVSDIRRTSGGLGSAQGCFSPENLYKTMFEKLQIFSVNHIPDL